MVYLLQRKIRKKDDNMKTEIYLTVKEVMEKERITQKLLIDRTSLRPATLSKYFNNYVSRVDFEVMSAIIDGINSITDKKYTIHDLIDSKQINNADQTNIDEYIKD